MRNDIRNLLAQDKAPDVFFTTMLDLYAIFRRPFHVVMRLRTYGMILRSGSNYWNKPSRTTSADPRLHPVYPVHEYEAILFSDPTWFGYHYEHHEKQIAELHRIAVSSPRLN